MKKWNKKIQSIEEILRELNLVPPWIETRGPKRKYFFHTMKKGQVIKKDVPVCRSRNIQVSIKQAANKQGFDVTVQNHGSYLLIRRNR